MRRTVITLHTGQEIWICCGSACVHGIGAFCVLCQEILFRSLERERLRLRDSRSFPAVSRSFLSDESPAIWKEGERRFDCWQGLLMFYAKGCVSLILIGLHHTHLHFKNIFVSQNCATFIYQDLTDYYIDLLYKLISFGTTWLHPKEKKKIVIFPFISLSFPC